MAMSSCDYPGVVIAVTGTRKPYYGNNRYGAEEPDGHVLWGSKRFMDLLDGNSLDDVFGGLEGLPMQPGIYRLTVRVTAGSYDTDCGTEWDWECAPLLETVERIFEFAPFPEDAEQPPPRSPHRTGLGLLGNGGAATLK